MFLFQDLVDGVVKTANTCIGWENSWSPLWLELGETGEWGGEAAAWAENTHRKKRAGWQNWRVLHQFSQTPVNDHKRLQEFFFCLNHLILRKLRAFIAH